MKRLIIFLLLFAAIKVAGQTTGYLRFDTVRIYKQGGTAELYLINSTKDSLGVLTNIGGGLTRFYKPRVLNDSTFTVGLDTLVLRGAGGGSSGDVDSLHIYTASAPDPDTIYQYIAGDSSLVGYIPKAPAAVLISQGWGITNSPNPITGTGTVAADSAALSGYYLRRKDSTLYTTIDSTYSILTRALEIVDTLEFIYSGSDLTTYQSDSLIGGKIVMMFINDYMVPFIERTGSIWGAFDSATGEIDFANGYIADDDLVKIIFRTFAIFLVDEDGNLVTDSNGNYIILN